LTYPLLPSTEGATGEKKWLPFFQQKHFHDEDEAFAYVEARVWPEGPVCPHCGGVERISKMQGKSTRKGLYKCYQCRKPFTVRMGTIFESSKVPLHVWLQAMYLIAGSKKGISSNQLARTLGLTVKTAWFLSHRIREAMREGGLAPFGADGGAVEVDETYIGRKAGAGNPKGGWGHKMTVLGLVDRNTGRAASSTLIRAASKFSRSCLATCPAKRGS
jgi:transposase-like protein